MALSERDQELIERLKEANLFDDLPEGFIEELSAANEKQETQRKEREQEERRQMLSNATTQNPYQSFLLNHEFHKFLEEKGVDIDDTEHALKRVALVGVLLPDTPFAQRGAVHIKDLWRDDSQMVVDVAKSFSQAGIPMHPNTEFTVYNLLPPVRSDFLMSAHPCAQEMDFEFPETDLVLISSVPKYGAPPTHFDYEVSRGYQELTAQELTAFRNCNIYTSVSGLHADPNVWAEASFNLGAKFIAVRGGTGDEVSTNHLKDHEQSRLLIESTSSQGIGYVARHNTLQDYASHVAGKNPLGTAIKRALK